MEEKQVSAKALYQGAELLYKKQQYDAAREAYEIALARAKEEDEEKLIISCELKLGDFAFVGFGKEPDFERAMQLYTAAYEKGSKAATNNMGYMYLNGKGCMLDKEKAIRLFEESAEYGNPMGLHNMAYCYQTGYEGLVEQNLKKAYQMYRKASKMGYKPSTESLKLFKKDVYGHVMLKEQE